MTCATCGSATLLRPGLGIAITGSGSPANPYVVTSQVAEAAVLEVRDTDTVNLSLAGAGTLADPYVLRADSGSAGRLTQLADVNSAAPVAGQVPVWVGSTTNGHWAFKPNGVLYVTSASRPALADRYPGLQIKETDTGKRFEWNGTAWEDVTPAVVVTSTTGSGGTTTTTTSSVAAGAITGTLNDSTLPGRIRQVAQLLTSEDLNTVLASGWYRGSNIANAPSTGWWYFEVIQHSTVYALQVAHSLTGWDTWKRFLNNGVWSAWDRIKTDRTVLREAAGDVTTSAMVADSSGRGFSQTIHVDLPSNRFTAPPAITLGVHTGSGQEQHVGAINTSATGFDLYYWRSAVANGVVISWQAKEKG